jgi:tetratricopeptide (TPR) repeat protein
MLNPRRKKDNSPCGRELEPARPPSRGRLWAFRLVALFLPVIVLAALEIGLRVGGYGFDTNFFRQVTIGGEDYYVQNDDFSYRFFPRETARNPGVLRMPVHKAAGTYRIFIFGESAAMGDPEPAYGAGRYLEMLLRDRFPGVKFEIVNTAFTAINSHVIVPIAQECARRDGDLWIIYMGNNEMVGPFGAATVFGMRAPPLIYVRLALAIQQTRTGQFFTALARAINHRGAKSTSWGGMQMFMQNQVSPDSPLKENVYRNFQKNLEDILQAGLGSGAKVLLNTVAVNLKDSPPFASMVNSNLPAADRDQAGRFYADGQAAEAQGDFKDAVSDYEQAGKIDSQSADLQFHWGKCLLALNELSSAREHLQLACDRDALPFRTDSRLNQLIADEAKRMAGEKLKFFDAAAALAAEAPEGVSGEETFYEHVHFDFDGSYRLALAWAQQVETMLPADAQKRADWLSQDACEQMLGLSDWNRALVVEHMITRMQSPPLNGQSDNSRRLKRLQDRDQSVHARMDTNDMVSARSNFVKQLAERPDDFTLHENFALFLQSIGDVAGTVSEWRRVHDLIPHDYLPYFQLGRVLGLAAQWPEAESCLRTAVAIHPSLTEGWAELGNVLAGQGKWEPALASYKVAREQRPQDGQTVFHMGMVYEKMGQSGRAVELYREAIQLNPGDWQSHFELGGKLDAAGQLDGAREEFEAAMKLNPGYSRTHFNYGVILAKQGRLADAEHEFEEALRLEPAYKNAQESLAKVHILEQQRSNGN